MTIHHIALWTNNLEQLKEFYLNYFNCSAGIKYENTQKQFSSYFIKFPTGAAIELMARTDIMEIANVAERIGYAHLAINVGNAQAVDALTRRMENDGIVVASDPRTTGDGYYESVILDPEGNRIELVAQ